MVANQRVMMTMRILLGQVKSKMIVRHLLSCHTNLEKKEKVDCEDNTYTAQCIVEGLNLLDNLEADGAELKK